MAIERKDSAVMGNCFKVYFNGRQFAIVHTEQRALALIAAMVAHNSAAYGDDNTDPYYYGLAYVEGAGF